MEFYWPICLEIHSNCWIKSNCKVTASVYHIFVLFTVKLMRIPLIQLHTSWTLSSIIVIIDYVSSYLTLHCSVVKWKLRVWINSDLWFEMVSDGEPTQQNGGSWIGGLYCKSRYIQWGKSVLYTVGDLLSRQVWVFDVIYIKYFVYVSTRRFRGQVG